MTDGQIERLLGGYATNTLTESERQALFEAALEDQELFNALQDEQALRELLEDSGSRRMLERAAQEPRPAPVRGWLGRPRFAHVWAWSLAGCAAAAGVLVFLWAPFGQTPRTSVEVAALKAPEPIETAAPKISDQQAVPVRGKAAKKSTSLKKHQAEIALSSSRDQISSPPAGAVVPLVAPPATPPPAPVAAPEQSAQTAVSSGYPAQRAAPGVSGFRAGVAPAVSRAAIPYSVTRRVADGSFATLSAGEELLAGDAVRVAVRPPVPGLLTLFEQSAGGKWNIIQMIQVTAGREFSVPPAPVQINGETRLRLMIMPGEGAGPSDLREAAKQALSRPKQRLDDTESATAPPVPAVRTSPRALTVDITLVPGKALAR